MTISKLFINGCSFLTPRPKDNVITHTGIDLARLLDLEIAENVAQGGRGNDRISFTTKLWFTQKRPVDTMAVIGWSSSDRYDYVTDDGWKKGRIPSFDSTWRTWKVGEQLRFVSKQPGWSIEQQSKMRFVDHVIDLQNFFKLNGIPYVMYNSLSNDLSSDNKDIELMKTQIDRSRFFRLDDCHFNYIMDNKMIVAPNDPHPSTEGHENWAKKLKEFIDANNLCTTK